MQSNGLTAIATSGDSPVQVLAGDGANYSTLNIVNMGSVAGFWTIGDPNVPTNWAYLPAAVGGAPIQITIPIPGLRSGQKLWIKRVPGGTDLASVWAWLS